jgi:mRNA-degrading endonuclease toxin of MazEF toxin-antitoxin module
MSRGDIYLADLNPSRGSEQAGIRPVVIVQREAIDRFTQTIVIVSNLHKIFGRLFGIPVLTLKLF